MILRRAFATYIPAKPLVFEKGRMRLYKNNALWAVHWIMQGPLYCSTAYFATQAFYAPVESEWTPFLTHSFTGFMSFWISTLIFRCSRKFVTELYLKSDGKTLEIYNATFFPFRKKTVNVIDIVKNPKERRKRPNHNFWIHPIFTYNKMKFLVQEPGSTVTDQDMLFSLIKGNDVKIDIDKKAKV